MVRRTLLGALVLGLVVAGTLVISGLLSRGERQESPEDQVAAVGDDATRDSVLAVVQELFDAIESRDTAAVRRVMHPEARLVSVSTGADSVEFRISSRTDFMASLLGTEAHMLERMWNAEVRLDGPMAMVWTPYDFHMDQEFSHCGVDVFDLIRTRQGWRIVSVTYTRHPPERCGEGPA